MAARHMASRCRRVLIADLCWTPYVQTLRDELSRIGKGTVLFVAREPLLCGQESAIEMQARLIATFKRERCDGAFYPAVSHDGIRLPADTIAGQLRALGKARFILVDAAQAVAHVSGEIGANAADLIVGGSHKWLGAGLPLGFAIGPNDVVGECRKCLADDPLAALTTSDDWKGRRPATETVNVWPLLSCNAAICELASNRRSLPGSQERQRMIREQVKFTFAGSSWNLLSPPSEFGSAIMLAQHSRSRGVPPEYWREHFHRLGIAVTSYGPLIRLSPRQPLSKSEQNQLAKALFPCTLSK